MSLLPRKRLKSGDYSAKIDTKSEINLALRMLLRNVSY